MVDWVWNVGAMSPDLAMNSTAIDLRYTLTFCRINPDIGWKVRKEVKIVFVDPRDGKMTFDKLTTEGDLPINKQNIIYFSCDPNILGSNMDNTWQKALYIFNQRGTHTRSFNL